MDDGGDPRGMVTAAARTCGSCGAKLAASAKFCSTCGAHLAPLTRSGEYKQVTVLFADVVHSMDLAAVLDMERLRDVMSELLESVAGVARRYGGAVEYAGDGVMAIFGAPVALEDHAFRACLVALAVQEEANRVAAEVAGRDGVDLRVRVGLNSGQVIVGEIGALGYRATGRQVGLAQRMESVAPPGGVMLSASTARLVEHVTVLGEPESVHVKGVDEPVIARRLLAVKPRNAVAGRAEALLVGRRTEMAILEAMLDRSRGARGGLVNVIGAPGIGKSRVAREVAKAATTRGVEVFWTFCESHASDIPFFAVTRLLREWTAVSKLDDGAARDRVRDQLRDADPQDLLLLDDLLGIADPEVPLPQIDPDARGRRLTALINEIALTRAEPALIILEDVHWIDAVSETMIAEFLTVLPQAKVMVLTTSRPEYEGALTQAPAAQAIVLAPLSDSDTAALLGELLGGDPSLGGLGQKIAERARGNPFFAEEMVRELAQRGVLAGERGGYVSVANVGEVSVPPTVQAAIGARIDRLTEAAKHTLNAASVIGTRFEANLLAALTVEAAFDELLAVELIDQVRFTPGSAEYAFRHPLIRAVAYESQLKSDRAEWHRRLAAAIQDGAPGSVEDNAALIAQHLEAAGEMRAAYHWHMRAGAWSANRDLVAARLSWQRAVRIADALPSEDPDHLAMRIAPRAMLCGTDLQAREVNESQARFAELRQLCIAAGDKVSLAIGMSGPATEACYAGRAREAARLASEQMALFESIGDPTPIMGLVPVALVNWSAVEELGEILRWSQRVIDLAAGDPARGAAFGVGSPLALALAWRSVARSWLGRPGWHQDIDDAVAMARRSNPETLSAAVAWTHGSAMQHGVLRVDDSILASSEEAVQRARSASNDRALGLAVYTLAVGLLNRDSVADRHRGLELMMQVREIWVRKRALFLIPVTDLWAAGETARWGDLDTAINRMRQAVDELRRAENRSYGLWGTGVLVQTLLERGLDSDLCEARAAIDRLATSEAETSSAMREITLLRLRALLARARGDPDHRDLACRYRAMAESLGFEGHFDRAEAMLRRC